MSSNAIRTRTSLFWMGVRPFVAVSIVVVFNISCAIFLATRPETYLAAINGWGMSAGASSIPVQRRWIAAAKMALTFVLFPSVLATLISDFVNAFTMRGSKAAAPSMVSIWTICAVLLSTYLIEYFINSWVMRS